MLTVSLSQINSWRACAQQYAYHYIDGLQKREAAPPLELGSAIHSYLEGYYRRLKEGVAADEAHEVALAGLESEWGPKLLELSELAYAMGAEDVSTELREMAAIARYLCERYWVVRGKADAERYCILLVEKELRVRLARGIECVGYADLVLEEQSTGLKYMVEHKSHKTIPSLGFRLRDAQTVLYAEMLKAMGGPKVDGVLWNYCRTTPPVIPERLKNGQFTRRALDSTWDRYERTLREAGEDVEAYSDMRDKLGRKELDDFFPREEYLIMGDAGIILRDIVASAQEIVKARKAWAKGTQKPIRHLSRNCDYACSYTKLCTAAIALGGEDLVRETYFSSHEQRRQRELSRIASM